MSSDQAAAPDKAEVNPNKEGTPVPPEQNEADEQDVSVQANAKDKGVKEDKKENDDKEEKSTAVVASHGNLFQITSAFNSLAHNMSNMVEQLHMQATTVKW